MEETNNITENGAVVGVEKEIQKEVLVKTENTSEAKPKEAKEENKPQAKKPVHNHPKKPVHNHNKKPGDKSKKPAVKPKIGRAHV